ncbi:unnamed protein product [Ectocarpus sp. 13 AM-2016]
MIGTWQHRWDGLSLQEEIANTCVTTIRQVFLHHQRTGEAYTTSFANIPYPSRLPTAASGLTVNRVRSQCGQPTDGEPQLRSPRPLPPTTDRRDGGIRRSEIFRFVKYGQAGTFKTTRLVLESVSVRICNGAAPYRMG